MFVNGLSSDASLHMIKFHAMGCTMGAWVATEDHRYAVDRLNLVRVWMKLVDQILSRFNPDSELSRLNEYSILPPVVSKLLWDALEWALDAAQLTGGLIDPTIMPALLNAGYEKDFSTLKHNSHGLPGGSLPWVEICYPGTDGDCRLGTSGSGWRMIERNPIHRTVSLPPDIRLDLGGTAKGWAAARAVEMLAPLGPSLVNAGGDLAVEGFYPADNGWIIGIKAPSSHYLPETSNNLLAVLKIGSCGVATSGIDYRWWIRYGKRMHHLIDPSTYQPTSTDLLSASVIAPNAAKADLYASVVIILGLEKGMAFLEGDPELEGLLVDKNSRCWESTGFGSYVSSPVNDLHGVNG